MHLSLPKISKRVRTYLRRRHRLFQVIVVLVVIANLVIFQHLFLETDEETALERSLINNPDDNGFSISSYLRGLIPLANGKKTVPFKHTDAASSVKDSSKDKIDNTVSNYDDSIRRKPGSSDNITPGAAEVDSANKKGNSANNDNTNKNSDTSNHKNRNSNKGKTLQSGTQESTDANGRTIDELYNLEKERRLRVSSDLHEKFYRSTHQQKRLQAGYRFFEEVFTHLYKGKPSSPPLTNYLSPDRIYHARYSTVDKDDTVFSEEYLSKFLQLEDEELDSMKDSHSYIVDNLPEHAPKGLYSGDGIVYVGGGNFNWLTLLSIKSIRAIGCKLPIEVVIPMIDEYEPNLCSRIFPALNARCIYLPNVLSDPNDKDSVVSKFEFKGYQYKALAILVSSFENVLLLDSDNIPVHSPDHLFKKKPFTNNGLIVWPDFWKRATSPDYYKIAGLSSSESELLPKYDEVAGRYIYDTSNTQTPLDLKNIPLHQRVGSIPDPTSESGQLMISKKTHTKALLLALYYNLYGPNYFYPLFSQGSDGEGDKETFLAATVALRKKFYQVSKFLNAFGHFNTKNEFEGTGMGQYDPVEDYEYNNLREEAETLPEAKLERMKQKNLLLANGPRILFVHANFPKLNPWTLKKEKKFINEKGERFRLYGTGMKVRTGYDFETVQWTNMRYLLCELKIELEIYSDVDRKELCEEINEHLAFLKSTIYTLE
ncbi:mannosyltransferase putative-domain-containing protein [Scheffersomyces xylosifermentans]|uniref:mannosyltransferase putative-domain-containing protein n=1 Tax=Scheffersomyces xylosifermentans TaxID=1304137 RepID=UPI00315CE8EA